MGYIDIAAFTQRYQDMVEFGFKGIDQERFNQNFEIIPIFTSANVADARVNGVEVTLNAESNWKKSSPFSFTVALRSST
ncbi:MAG: hypothetical protein R3B47_03345 [Bacteroidia bacterium]